MSTRSLQLGRLSACVVGTCTLMAGPAHSANPTLPPTLGASPVETAIFNAVVNTCLTLDVLGVVDPETGLSAGNLTTKQQDLHDQCHGLASAALGPGAAANSSTVLGALQQVSGNQYSSQGALATRVVSGQFTNISGRLSVLRLGAAAPTGQFISFNNNFSLGNGDSTAPNITLPLANPLASGAASNTAFVGNSYTPAARSDAPLGGGAGSSASVQSPFGVYIQGSYNSGHHDETQNEDAFDFHATSVTAGADYNFGNAVLGVSLGYDDYDAGFRPNGTSVNGGGAQVKGTSGSIYGAWFNQSWNFNGIATYGRLQTNLSRVVSYAVTYAQNTIPNPLFANECPTTGPCTVQTTRTLTGDPDGTSFAIGATAGYQTQVSGWDVAPSVSFNYRRATVNSFTETDPNPPTGGDGLALAFDDQTIDSLRSIVGLDLSTPISAPFGVVTPLFRVEWDHEFKTGARFISAHYAATDGIGTGCLSCFALPTDTQTANYGLFGVGFSVLLAHRVQAFIFDEASFGIANYSSNSIAIGLRGQF